MDETLFRIIECVATILGIIIVRYLVPYITEKTSDAKYNNLKDFIKKAICFMESTITESGSGETKFDRVCQYAVAWMAKLKINITTDQLKILVQGIFDEANAANLVNTDK